MANRAKNKYEFKDNVCIGYTSSGKTFIFDKFNYDKVSQHIWHISKFGYVISQITLNNGKQERFSMHRLLTECPSDKIVDHINRNKADNRISNLRICSRRENAFNVSTQKRNKLGAKGVSLTHCGTYQAQIQIDGKQKYLGSYKTIKEASDAYDVAAKEYFGEFASLNNYNDC